MSQERFAAEVDVDRTTVQSWESGRRPFTSVSVGQALAVRHRASSLGADAGLLRTLGQAPEADLLIEAVLSNDPSTVDITHHPLGRTVLTHALTELIAWAVAGDRPTFLDHRSRSTARRGPVPEGPCLPRDERQAFFDNLRIVADRTDQRGSDGVVLHRQACFLAGFDPSGGTAEWFGAKRARAMPSVAFQTWSPLWPNARSVATSLAKQGDREMLHDFIARAHPDDACELAGLNYWAYWVGEIEQPQRDDSFMVNRTWSWRGGRLLRHLADRLEAHRAFVDLNTHSLWALLAARRDLVLDDPALGVDLLVKADRLLEVGGVSRQSERELTSIIYGLRMSGFTRKEHGG